LAAAHVIAVLAAPTGISGAVLLLPFRVSVLDTPSPFVTPTNLLYDVVATLGALYRYWRQRQSGGRLVLMLIAGTLPGVIAGSVIRVELLPGPQVSTWWSAPSWSRWASGWRSPGHLLPVAQTVQLR
jgi:uncharacterized protein